MNKTYEYSVVIETNQYAGNFEREMCAFITGCIGECEVGGKEADIALSELDEYESRYFANRVINKMDDSGCNRPVSICGSPEYNSLQIYFSTDPCKDIQKVIVARANNFCDRRDKLQIKSINVITNKIITEYKVRNLFTVESEEA